MLKIFFWQNSLFYGQSERAWGIKWHGEHFAIFQPPMKHLKCSSYHFMPHFMPFCYIFVWNHKYVTPSNFQNYVSMLKLVSSAFALHFTEISVPLTTEIFVKSNAKADETSYFWTKFWNSDRSVLLCSDWNQ